jgi:hypothetical protein
MDTIRDRNFTFMMHCGAESVELSQLRDLVTPDAETSDSGRIWQPIPHFDFQREIRESLTRQGMEVVNEAHAITQNRKRGEVGDRYFGFLQLAGGNGTCEVVGMRNSHDKTFSASIVMGMGVFVCDNLSFSGEIKITRKHTRGILDDIPRLAARSVSRLNDLRGWQEKRVGAYRDHELETRAMVNDLIMESYRAKAVPSSQIGKVIEAWEEQPTHELYADEFGERNVWSLFNAFTETFKERVNPHALSQRTQILHGVFDNYIGLAKPAQFEEVG